MFTTLLHRITDFSSSKRGKFVVIALWLVIALAIKAAAPNLASLYDTSANQRLPSTADSQVATRLLLKEFPTSRGLPAIIVFHDPTGLNVDDRIRIHQVSDWLTSDQKPSLVGEALSVFTVPQATSQLLSAARAPASACRRPGQRGDHQPARFECEGGAFRRADVGGDRHGLALWCRDRL